MIKHIMFTHDKTAKHIIDEYIEIELRKHKIKQDQVINVQITDATTYLYQIWIWYHEM